MSPILLGLVLAAPVSVWTSRTRYGRALASRKILATPEELNPPDVILLADRANAAVDPALDAALAARRGVSPPSSIPMSTASTSRCSTHPR
jgi:membrane glycosyltransferase